MMNKVRRNRNLITDENGDARITAGFVVAGGITFILLAVILFTDLPPIGPDEGELAPNLQGKVHYLGASDWVDFELYEETDSSWDAESNPEGGGFTWPPPSILLRLSSICISLALISVRYFFWPSASQLEVRNWPSM